MNERPQIGRNEIHNIIKHAVDERPKGEGEPQELFADEQAILNEILSSVPDKLSDRQIFYWCKNKVDEILKKHPSLSDKSESIKNVALKEMRYKIDEKRYFIPVRDAILNKKPSYVSYEWIKNNVDKGSSIVSKLIPRYRTLDGSVDSDFVFKKLETSGVIFKYERHINWTEQLIQKELQDFMNTHPHQKIYISTIESERPKLYNAILRFYPTAEGSGQEFNLEKIREILLHEDKERLIRKPKITMKEVTPEKFYSSNNEVKRVLAPYKKDGSIHLIIYDSKDKKESSSVEALKREEIYQKLIELARKGNTRAMEEIQNNLKTLIT